MDWKNMTRAKWVKAQMADMEGVVQHPEVKSVLRKDLEDKYEIIADLLLHYKTSDQDALLFVLEAVTDAAVNDAVAGAFAQADDEYGFA